MRKSVLRVLVAVVALVGMVGVSALPAVAEGEETNESQTGTGSSLRLTPTGVRINLTPGTVIEGTSEYCKSSSRDTCSVDVQNMGQETFTYKVYATPYVVTNSEDSDEAGVSFEDDGQSSYTQIARWITVKDSKGNYVDSTSFTIEPGKTQTVYYKITVPESIPDGSQYAVLWAEIQGVAAEGSGIVTLGRVGEVIVGQSTSGTTIETAELNQIKMTGFSFGGLLSASAKVKNTGNADFTVRHSYTVKTLFGKEVFTSSKSVTAFPGVEYKIENSWDKPPLLGIFLTTFEVTGANINQTVTKITVIMPVWVMILIILLLTIIVVWIILVVRKRKERKIRKIV